MSGLFLASYVMLWVCVVVLGLAVLALLRQVGVLHARLRPTGVHFAGEGPEIGTKAPPAFAYTSTLTVVAFTAPDCTICAGLRPGLRAIGRDYRDVRVEVVDHSPATAAVFDAFNVRSTPYLVAVDATGTVRVRGIANTLDQAEVMLQEALSGNGSRDDGAS